MTFHRKYDVELKKKYDVELKNLLIYPMNRCMHMLFQYCISTVMDEYTINFDGSYCKYDVIGHPKEFNFSRGPILPIPAVS